jgi:hypothetical protein
MTMADPVTPPNPAQQNIERTIAAADGVDPAQAMAAMQQPQNTGPIYKLDPIGKIPVSKYEGLAWESKIKAGKRVVKPLTEMWDEAESYYSNAQQSHRKDTAGNMAGNRGYSKDRRDAYSVTENIVYSTVNAVVPNIYAKNPDCEITMFDPQRQVLGDMLEHLVDRLAAMESAPGFNLKPKVKKSIVRCEITNEAWVLLGYNKKEFSADQAREDIRKLGEELVAAKSQKEVEEVEGKLMALEESCDLLDPAGPFVKSIRGEDVTVDASSVEDDFSDSGFLSVDVMIPTNYLNARYRKKDKNGNWISEYKPTDVVDIADDGNEAASVQAEVDSFKMFDDTKDNPKDYGYKDRNAYERAKRTKCCYIFDKVKRRFYLYATNDWTWPIWVMDDPYHLPNFWPVRRLQYHTDPRMNRTKGEVSNYLDQQDIINTSQDEKMRMRTLVRDNLIFNSNVLTTKDVEDIILNANKKAKGIKLPEGMKLEDVIMAPPTPTLQFESLWDTSDAMRAINMISGVGEAQRGEQFRTNTTNDAIKEYSSISGVRLDEKRDAVEDFIGGIMHDILFMCLQFMDQETVGMIVGSQYADLVQQWQPMEPNEIRQLLMCSVAGGSSQKPTAATKKAEAMQVGQILGQFASATPYAIVIALKVFMRSFDGVVMEAKDWEQLYASIEAQMQRGNSQQGGQQAPQDGPQEEAEEQDPNDSPEFKAMVDKAVSQGIPKNKAEAMIRTKLAEQQSQPQ